MIVLLIESYSARLILSYLIRIMDCFLLDGVEIIFRLALTLLTLGKHDLLLLDMEGVIKVHQHHVVPDPILEAFRKVYAPKNLKTGVI